MSSRSLDGLRAAAFAAGLAAAAPAAGAERELRVCADPDNLPYSHADGRGFELRIAELLAREMGARLRVHWAELRRGFVRKTLGAGLCDVVIGVPAGFERTANTRPYYRSTYVFVSRDRAAPLASFDDPRLAGLRIGVQLVGDDMEATPPGHALALRGAIDNVVGFPPYGEGSAAQRMLAAIASGGLDAGVVWGPQAGYFAARAVPPLALAPARPPEGLPPMPFEFAITVGVKRGNTALRDELDGIVARRGAQIDAILDAHAVPRVARAAP